MSVQSPAATREGAIDPRLRWRLHLLPLAAAVFLSVYGKVVCEFIATIALAKVLFGLAAVALFQVILREAMFRTWPSPRGRRTPARHVYLQSVASWLVAGLFAMLVHARLYPTFPLGSHLKLLSGYWALGAGILAQVEYVAAERHFRRQAATPPAQVVERITARLMEGYAAVSVVPALVLVLMGVRFWWEGFAERGVAIEVAFLAVVFVSAALLLAHSYGRALREDCDRILGGLADVREGRYGLRLDSTRADELGQVARGITQMSAGLALRERIRDAFGRFVDPAVADAFIAEYADPAKPVTMGGRRAEVTVLLADLCSFTPLSERLGPEMVTELLNEHFADMVAAVRAHGGMVDKFMGDAVMAVFGLTGQAGHSAAALATAGDMRAALARANLARRRAGRPELAMGIGLHRGEVVAGYFGSPDRLEFSVIGPPVNIAARIQAQARPPRADLLLSRAVADHCPGVAMTVIGRIDLKGVSQAVELLTPAG